MAGGGPIIPGSKKKEAKSQVKARGGGVIIRGIRTKTTAVNPPPLLAMEMSRTLAEMVSEGKVQLALILR